MLYFFSDGLFSPLAVNFQNSSSERGQPVGGVMPAVSPLTYTHSISPAHLTDANQNRSNKEDYQDYHDYRVSVSKLVLHCFMA